MGDWGKGWSENVSDVADKDEGRGGLLAAPETETDEKSGLGKDLDAGEARRGELGNQRAGGGLLSWQQVKPNLTSSSSKRCRSLIF